jgi:hypothetical protein
MIRYSKEEPKQYPKTFKELFANTGIKPTTDESGNIQYNFKSTMKEETKQKARDYANSLVIKQETLEEAAANHQKGGYEWQNEKRKSFIAGAKWQSERRYSKEEVLEILRKSHSIEKTSKAYSWIIKWFEQFKKK